MDERKKENYDKAIDYLQKALDFNAENVPAWSNLGYCYDKSETLANMLSNGVPIILSISTLSINGIPYLLKA